MSETAGWKRIRDERLREPGALAAHHRAPLALELSRQVRELRESVGISQRELAKRMGTTQSVIARLEAGGSKPSLTTLERVADAVGRQVEVRFLERAPTEGHLSSSTNLDLAQLAANLGLTPAERLSRATTFGRWVLRNRGRARAGAGGRARPA